MIKANHRFGLLALAWLCVTQAFAVRYSGEYYWNTDPGFGKATKIAATEIGANNTMQMNIDVTTVNPGINILGMRVFNGRWSPTITSYVLVPAPNITSGTCEYWWDTDPGLGKANKFTVTTNGNGPVNIDIPVNGMRPGLHKLGLRMMVNGRWSPTQCSAVYIGDPTNSTTIAYAEYFWGPDPGFGKGTPIDITKSKMVVIENLDIPLPTQPLKDYSLTIRACSSNGNWGPSYTKVFSASTSVGISLDYRELTLNGVGSTHKLIPTVTTDAEAWARTVVWSSSKESVATVDQEGNVKAVGTGWCLIKAQVAGTEVFDDCEITVKGQQVTRVDLVDGTTYDANVGYDNITVTYQRNFNNKSWQPLYIPFDMSYEEWAPYAEVAEVNNVLGYDDDNDGTIDRSAIEFNRVKSGSLKPNVPYVIRGKQTGTVTFTCEGKKITEAPATNGYVECSSTRFAFRLNGVYESTNGFASMGAYVMSGGAFGPAANDNVTIKPNRMYLTVTPKEGGYNGSTAHRLPQRVDIIVDGETTSIEDVEIYLEDDDLYYDLLGRPTTNPKQGFYIKNGNKIYVK